MGIVHQIRARWRTALERRMIAESGLFEADWYLSAYSDVVGADVDPQTHYLRHGAGEGRDPSPLFETEFYLSQYPGLDPAAVNPLCHYLTIGDAEGARPNRYFDPQFYRTQIGEGALRGVNSLSHYLSLDPKTGIDPGPNFAAARYLEQHPGVAEAGLNPLWHFLASARRPAGPPGDHSAGALRRAPAPRAGELLEVGSYADLEHVGNRGGLGYWRVTGPDPQMVLARRGGRVIEPGHYKLVLEFAGRVSLLRGAILYIDAGAGFSERESRPLRFKEVGRGLVGAGLTLPAGARVLRFDPTDVEAVTFGLGGAHLRRLGRIEHYSRLVGDLAPSPLEAMALSGAIVKTVLKGGFSRAAADLRARQAEKEGHSRSRWSYQAWIDKYDTITDDDRAAIAQMIEDFAHRPKISVVMPVYDTPKKLLREAIESVLDQTYDNWELCIADDCSTRRHVRAILKNYMRRDARIKVVFRTENGHISNASNSAIEIATGEWVALLDHDDRLAPHALFCIVDAINKRPDSKLIYSDEDKIDDAGHRSEPYFKSDWNERLFFGQNMISHLGVYRTDLVREIGGFRRGYEGSQDHDLALRCIERISADAIVHVPHVLYHWRATEGSTALAASEKHYALDAGVKAVRDAFERRGIAAEAEVEAHSTLTYYRVRMPAPDPAPKVSILIPTRDGLNFLEPCVSSILDKTTYANYEILIIDNQSVKAETIAYFDRISKTARVRILKYDAPFNYSAINNFAVKNASGEFVCLLNNDTEVIARDWLSELVAEGSQPGVGGVGAKLLYTDGMVQHSGVVVGLGGVAGHAFLGMPADHPGYFGRNLLCSEVSAVTAACLVMPKRVFEEVGGLDERQLKVAFNDVDLCLKVRAAGYKIIWTPYALLFHHESKSRGYEDTPEKIARFNGEIQFMIKKWGGLLATDPYYNPNLCLDCETFPIAKSPRIELPWRRSAAATHGAQQGEPTDQTPARLRAGKVS